MVDPAEITVSAVFERLKVSPWGLFGGGNASNAAILVKKTGDDQFRTFSEVYGTVSPGKFVNCVVEAGDQLLLQSPGGGGYGEVTARDAEMVLEDVEQGFVSEQAAHEVYKVAVAHHDGGWTVNEDETARLRAS